MVPSPPEASFGSGVFLGIDEYYPGPKTNPRFSPKSCLAVEFWADLSPPIPAYPHPRPVLSLAHNPLPRPRVLSPSPTKPSYRQHARQSARAAGRAEPRRAARTAAGKGAAGGARAAGGAEHLTRQRQPWIPPSRSTPLPFLESDRRRHLPPFRYSVLPPLRLAFSPVNSFSDELPPSWDRVTTPIFGIKGLAEASFCGDRVVGGDSPNPCADIPTNPQKNPSAKQSLRRSALQGLRRRPRISEDSSPPMTQLPGSLDESLRFGTGWTTAWCKRIPMLLSFSMRRSGRATDAASPERDALLVSMPQAFSWSRRPPYADE